MSTSIPFSPLPLAQEDVSYEYGPDSVARPGAEPGMVEQFRMEASRHFPGTTRSVCVHRPAGHRADEPSAVMFFNDGWWYLDPDGDVRGGILLDNLAAAHDLPQIIGWWQTAEASDASRTFTHGDRLRRFGGVPTDQIEHIIRALRSDEKNTRAVAVLIDPTRDSDPTNSNRFPGFSLIRTGRSRIRPRP